MAQHYAARSAPLKAVLGPTNTGKTHLAIERLCAHSSGMIGIPAAPADLRQAHLRCGDLPEDLFRVLATGLSGTPMLSFEATLTEAQRWDIIAFVLSIRLPSGPVL
jgi:hypothetical protein